MLSYIFAVFYVVIYFSFSITDPTGLMIAIRALESLGTLLILISLILAIVKQCSKAGQQSLFKAAGNLIIIAGDDFSTLMNLIVVQMCFY